MTIFVILLLLKGKNFVCFTIIGKTSILKYIIFIIKIFFVTNRIDGHEEYFGLTNILYNNNLYDNYWSRDDYQNTYKQIFIGVEIMPYAEIGASL